MNFDCKYIKTTPNTMLSSDFYIKYHTDLTFLYPNAIKYQHIRKRCPQADGFIVRNIHEYARNYQKNIAERLMDIDGDC